MESILSFYIYLIKFTLLLLLVQPWTTWGLQFAAINYFKVYLLPFFFWRFNLLFLSIIIIHDFSNHMYQNSICTTVSDHCTITMFIGLLEEITSASDHQQTVIFVTWLREFLSRFFSLTYSLKLFYNPPIHPRHTPLCGMKL